MFLWAQLPENITSLELFELALKDKVVFVPGEPFHPAGGGKNTMRINFSNATPEAIEVGIQRLGSAITEKLAKQVA